MTARRILAAIIGLGLASVASGVAAQGGPVPAGEPATYVDVAGVEQGSVTVTDIIDPYTDFPVDRGPEAGTRFVIVTFSIEGTGDEGIEIYTPSIWLQDTTGALWSDSLPCCITDDFPQPRLTIATVAQGSLITGFMGYTLPDAAEIQAVLYQPEGGVILIPADLGSARPALDTPVAVVGADEAQMTATVTKVEDPYKAFDKDRPPADGARFVMITARFENTGPVPFEFETNGVLLRDARGSLWASTEVTPAKKPRTAELKSIDLGPGNRVSGRLGFQVPKDVDLEGLYFQGGGHLTRLVALSGSGPDPNAGEGASCEEHTAWWNAVQPLLSRLLALPPFQPDSGAMDLAASEAMLDDLGEILVGHLNVEPPAASMPAHRWILGALQLYRESARLQVVAQEGDDAASLLVSQETFEAAQLVGAQALQQVDEAGLAACGTDPGGSS